MSVDTPFRSRLTVTCEHCVMSVTEELGEITETIAAAAAEAVFALA